MTVASSALALLTEQGVAVRLLEGNVVVAASQLMAGPGVLQESVGLPLVAAGLQAEMSRRPLDVQCLLANQLSFLAASFKASAAGGPPPPRMSLMRSLHASLAALEAHGVFVYLLPGGALSANGGASPPGAQHLTTVNMVPLLLRHSHERLADLLSQMDALRRQAGGGGGGDAPA